MSWFQVMALSFLCKIVACSYRFAGINSTSCVACTKTTDQKDPQNPNKIPPVPYCYPLGFCIVLETSRSWNQAHPQGNSNEINVQPWELIWPKPHFLFKCRNQGHFPIWILQRLLHILMSYTFYQTLTIIFRARKWLHSVRGSQEIRWRLLVLTSRPYIYYVPPLLCPPKLYPVSFQSTMWESVLLCLQNLTLNARWHHSSSVFREVTLLHICRFYATVWPSFFCWLKD